MDITINIPEAFTELWQPHRFKIYYGGRGGGKSWAFAHALIAQATERKLRVLCTREIQENLDASVKRLLGDIIERLGLSAYWDVQVEKILGKNGSAFYFEGLKYNISGIRSLEGIDRVWVEEGASVSKESWDYLLPTIRKTGSEIWCSANRNRPDDPFFELFCKNPRPNSVVKQVNLEDNPWTPRELHEEAQWCAAHDGERFEHIWRGGPWLRQDSLVFANKYVVESFQTPADASFMCGADFGFSSDPLAITRAFVGADNTLYVDREAVVLHCEVPDMARVLESVLPDRRWPCKADSSRPELISYLNNCGFNLIPSRKGSGSIMDGIDFLLSFDRIVIHPRCRTVIDEFSTYSYRTDKLTGAVLPVLEGRRDHCVDSLRYSVEDIYRPAWVSPIPDWDVRGYLGI
jgi:phage terminase large subunit